MNPISRIKNLWNVFRENDRYELSQTVDFQTVASYHRPDRVKLNGYNERSIVSSIYNRISVDAASVVIKHVKVDQNGNFIDNINSDLNDALTISANMDQTGRAFIQDAVMSLCDEGCIAIVPTQNSPNTNYNTLNLSELRVGKIIEWRPHHVRIELYDEDAGKRRQIFLNKEMVAIIENPFYSVMNETNGTANRLIRKLNLLDSIDEQSASGKLDLIVQLPYSIKSDLQKNRAIERKKDIDDQLNGSNKGIVYMDSTEKITQLNRPVENNLLDQIKYLTEQLFSQLSITQSILDGTADEQTMLNYYYQTIEPILSAIVDEMKRKFLSKTARTQGQSIVFYRNPFRLAPVSQVAELADKLIRNEILTKNEFRGIIGYEPSDEPNADILQNPNMPYDNYNTIEGEANDYNE